MRSSVVKRAPRKEGFKALGVFISFTNGFERELTERIARAWRAFYANLDLLKCKSASLVKRIELLNVIVAHSLFWCSGSWNLTVTQATKLRVVQSQMLRKMLNFRPQPNETKVDFMIRTNSKIKHLKGLHHIIDWDKMYHRSVFIWAGHVARMAQYAPERETYQALKYRNWSWIQQVTANNSGSQLHGYHLRIWRWEYPLYKFFSESDWMEVAQDKIVWMSQLDAFMDWRCRAA